MAFIVAEPCIKCKFVDCVAICPVMCFHEGANCLVIDPEECIDCGACVDQCPVNAIFSDDELPERWREYRMLNAKYARVWPVISSNKEALPEAEQFRNVASKRELFDPNPGPGDAG